MLGARCSASAMAASLGGCRCQAYMPANDLAAADPVCIKSPHHALVRAAVERAERGEPVAKPLVFRDPKNSKRLNPV